MINIYGKNDDGDTDYNKFLDTISVNFKVHDENDNKLLFDGYINRDLTYSYGTEYYEDTGYKKYIGCFRNNLFDTTREILNQNGETFSKISELYKNNDKKELFYKGRFSNGCFSSGKLFVGDETLNGTFSGSSIDSNIKFDGKIADENNKTIFDGNCSVNKEKDNENYKYEKTEGKLYFQNSEDYMYGDFENDKINDRNGGWGFDISVFSRLYALLSGTKNQIQLRLKDNIPEVLILFVTEKVEDIYEYLNENLDFEQRKTLFTKLAENQTTFDNTKTIETLFPGLSLPTTLQEFLKHIQVISRDCIK